MKRKWGQARESGWVNWGEGLSGANRILQTLLYQKGPLIEKCTSSDVHLVRES